MIKIPEYYQQVKSMPGDPKGSVPYMTQSHQATVFLIMYPIKDKDAMPYDKEKAIIGIHSAMDDDQGLIEAESGITDNGRQYIYTIVKTKKEPVSVLYTLTGQVSQNEDTCYFQGFFESSGETGLRESVLYAAMRRKGIVGDSFEGWSEDPYDPSFTKGFLMNKSELKQFDEAFPEHPLSMARELMSYICDNN